MIKRTLFFTLLFFSISAYSMGSDFEEFGFNKLFETESSSEENTPAENQHALNKKLLYACKKNETEIALKALESGAEPHIYEASSSLTPLIFAAFHKNKLLVRAILNKDDTNVNIASHAGFTPLCYALSNSKKNPKKAELIIRLLLRNKAKLPRMNKIELYYTAFDQWNCDMNLFCKYIDVTTGIPMRDLSRHLAAIKLQQMRQKRAAYFAEKIKT